MKRFSKNNEQKHLEMVQGGMPADSRGEDGTAVDNGGDNDDEKAMNKPASVKENTGMLLDGLWIERFFFQFCSPNQVWKLARQQN